MFGKGQIENNFQCLEKRKFIIPMFGKGQIENSNVCKSEN